MQCWNVCHESNFEDIRGFSLNRELAIFVKVNTDKPDLRMIFGLAVFCHEFVLFGYIMANGWNSDKIMICHFGHSAISCSVAKTT